MHLLYINSKNLRLLSYKKDIFKQFKIDFFAKKYSTKLLENGKVYNIDILASAIKEAISNVFQGEKYPKDVLIILPSPPFLIKRIILPLDVHEQAIASFVNQKMISLYPYKDLEFFFTLHEFKDKRLAIVYALEKENLDALSEVAKILDLNLVGVVPETLSLFKLFDNTLSKTKEENIWYMQAERTEEKIETKSYFYDNYGPIEEQILEFITENLEKLKEKIKKEKEKRKIKYNRLILAGNLSLEVRQDLLTKEIDIWVNPLPKIIESFYKTETKKITNQDPKLFLKYDSHFSLITHPDIPKISYKKRKTFFETERNLDRRIPRIKPFILPFLISLAITISAVFTFQNFKLQEFSKIKIKEVAKTSTPTPTISSTPTPTPAPQIKKDELKIKVLNGSGIRGQASKLSSYLKEKGYKDIVTGNADEFDYETTIVKVKKDSYKNIILKDLKDLTENPKIESLAEEDSPEDIVIIIGKDLELQ